MHENIYILNIYVATNILVHAIADDGVLNSKH